jgi:hypothetical protein
VPLNKQEKTLRLGHFIPAGTTALNGSLLESHRVKWVHRRDQGVKRQAGRDRRKLKSVPEVHSNFRRSGKSWNLSTVSHRNAPQTGREGSAWLADLLISHKRQLNWIT